MQVIGFRFCAGQLLPGIRQLLFTLCQLITGVFQLRFAASNLLLKSHSLSAGSISQLSQLLQHGPGILQHGLLVGDRGAGLVQLFLVLFDFSPGDFQLSVRLVPQALIAECGLLPSQRFQLFQVASLLRRILVGEIVHPVQNIAVHVSNGIAVTVIAGVKGRLGQADKVLVGP